MPAARSHAHRYGPDQEGSGNAASHVSVARDRFTLVLLRLVRHPDLWAVGCVLVVAVAMRALFSQYAPVFFEGDARGYLVRAVEISAGDGFNFTLKRTPGYSLLMAGIFAIPGPSLEAVVAVQHLFGAITAILAYGCARTLAGWSAGLVAGLATAASGSALIYERAILTESTFTLILVASLWVLIVGTRCRGLLWYAAAGLLAGAGALVRPVGLMLALITPVLCALARGSGGGWVAGGVFTSAACLVLVPWIVHNALVHGEAAPVHPGRFLIERTIKNNQTGISMYDTAPDPHDSRLVREGHKILREIEPEGPTSYEVHSALTRELELSDAEASDLMWELATDAILREPDAYLVGTWIELAGLVRGQHESASQHIADRRSAWKGEELEQILKDGVIPTLIPEVWPGQEWKTPIAETLANLYQPSHWIGLLLFGSALAAIWGVRDPSRRSVLIVLGIVAALAACTVTVNGAYPRYRYPLDPLLHVTAAAGLVWTFRTLASHRFDWRAARTGPTKPVE
jgi:hypothetical protein